MMITKYFVLYVTGDDVYPGVCKGKRVVVGISSGDFLTGYQSGLAYNFRVKMPLSFDNGYRSSVDILYLLHF